MATKKVKQTSADEIVEELNVTEDAPVSEGTDVNINVTQEVSADDKEAVEAAMPKPVPKGSRRGSKALQLELERTKELAQENEDKYKRLLAEFENARVRNEKESKKMYDIGAKEVLERLLPVVDNFERAIMMIPEEDKQLMNTLEGIGVAAMNAEGKEFDADLHNAVIHVEDESFGENIVVEEMQKGYMYKDQVLRHSMVKVAN